jgi:hypothetical protein
VKRNILIGLELINGKYHCDQFLSLNLLHIGLVQDLNVLEEFDKRILDLLYLAQFLQLELSGKLKALFI